MDGATREEVRATYAHPYRRWLPLGYRTSHVDVLVGVTAAVWAVVAVLDATGSDAADGFAALGWLVLVVALVWTTVVTLASVRIIRDRTRAWRPAPPSELERVRRGRPHAADVDPVLCHDEFAVTVEAGDRLVTWRYRTLAAATGTRDGERVIPGTPRRAVSAVAETPYDGTDVAAAGEALVNAQTEAAERERDAITRSHAAREAGDVALERRAESDSTRDALRRLTGQ